MAEKHKENERPGSHWQDEQGEVGQHAGEDKLKGQQKLATENTEQQQREADEQVQIEERLEIWIAEQVNLWNPSPNLAKLQFRG
jgi:hypothetical protein